MTAAGKKTMFTWPRMAVCVAFFVAAAFATWQAYELWAGPEATAGLNPIGRHAWTAGPRPTTDPIARPADILELALADTGVAVVDEDPGGIEPPPGAMRRAAVACRSGGQTVQMARYDCESPPAEALAHYRSRLEARGFRRIGNHDRPDGLTVQTYVAGAFKANVSLRKPNTDSTMASIVLQIIGPARQAD